MHQMNFPHRWLTEKLAIAGQITLNELSEIEQAGIKSVICNRPDGEGGPQQPTAEELEAAAAVLDIQFAYLPVSPFGGTPAQAIQLGNLMESMPAPILVFCASGGRSMGLIGLAAQLGHQLPT